MQLHVDTQETFSPKYCQAFNRKERTAFLNGIDSENEQCFYGRAIRKAARDRPPSIECCGDTYSIDGNLPQLKLDLLSACDKFAGLSHLINPISNIGPHAFDIPSAKFSAVHYYIPGSLYCLEYLASPFYGNNMNFEYIHILTHD